MVYNIGKKWLHRLEHRYVPAKAAMVAMVPTQVTQVA